MDKDLLKEWNQLQGLDDKYFIQFTGHKYWKEYIIFLEEKINRENNVLDENIEAPEFDDITEGYSTKKEKINEYKNK